MAVMEVWMHNGPNMAPWSLTPKDRRTKSVPADFSETILVNDKTWTRSIRFDWISEWFHLEAWPVSNAVRQYTAHLNNPSVFWQIDHNLGSKDVQVVVAGSHGEPLLAAVTVVDKNTIEVHFGQPTVASAQVWA